MNVENQEPREVRDPIPAFRNEMVKLALSLDEELLSQFNLSEEKGLNREWDRHPWSDSWRDSHRR